MRGIFLVLGLAISFTAYAEKTKGVITYLDNSELEVVFDIPQTFGMVNYIKLQEKVKYYDQAGKKSVLRPEQSKEISFMFKGESVRMISLPKYGDLSLGNSFSSSENIFLRLESEGRLRVFTYEFKQSTPGMMGANGMMMGGYTYSVDKYLLQKEGGPLKWPKGLTFRKDMMDYFSDCPELAAKIDKKEYKKDDLLQIVEFYNTYCK